MTALMFPASGEDVLRLARASQTHYRRGRLCGGCGIDVSRTGITSLVYTHVTCECEAAPYTHLIEQLWHADCFVASRNDR